MYYKQSKFHIWHVMHAHYTQLQALPVPPRTNPMAHGVINLEIRKFSVRVLVYQTSGHVVYSPDKKNEGVVVGMVWVELMMTSWFIGPPCSPRQSYIPCICWREHWRLYLCSERDLPEIVESGLIVKVSTTDFVEVSR